MKKHHIPRLVGKTRPDGVTNWYWQPSKSLREKGWSSLPLGAAVGTDPPAAVVEACLAENRKVNMRSGSRPRGSSAICRLERRKQWIERQLKLLRDPDCEPESKLKAAALRSTATKIYFIAALRGPIKIGLSTDPERRLRTLQTHHPKELRLLAETPGDHRLEAEYHRRFAPHRLKGEWFAPHADILEEIRRVRRAVGKGLDVQTLTVVARRDK